MNYMERQKHSECGKPEEIFELSSDMEMSLSIACKMAEQFLTSCGIEDAAVDAWYLLEYVTGISRAAYLADRGKSMSKEQRDAYAALVDRRGAHIPLQHLTGEQEFMGLPFLVNEHVLIPRQDTETLVELALEKMGQLAAALTGPQILDLCTGSGCIAVSLAKLWEHRSGQTAAGKLRITASDISEEALAVARENARRLQAEIRFARSDLFSAFCTGKRNKTVFSTESHQQNASDSTDDPTGYLQNNSAAENMPSHVGGNRFHMIVSNPPYIRTSVIEELSEEVRAHEPRMALDGGEDGLEFYRRIIRESRDYLLPGGWLLLEIGFDQGEAVSELMRQNGFLEVQTAKDLPGHDRVVSGRNP